MIANPMRPKGRPLWRLLRTNRPTIETSALDQQGKGQTGRNRDPREDRGGDQAVRRPRTQSIKRTRNYSTNLPIQSHPSGSFR